MTGRFISAYERENAHQENQRQNEAREMIIALPNELADKNKNQTSAEQKIILKEICDELVNQIVGEGHDHEYAVHWNHDRTNLHVHILYSERKVIQTEPKRYKKIYGRTRTRTSLPRQTQRMPNWYTIRAIS